MLDVVATVGTSVSAPRLLLVPILVPLAPDAVVTMWEVLILLLGFFGRSGRI